MKLMTIICVATGYILGAILYDLYKDRRKKKRESITLEEKAKEFVSKRASGTSQEMDYYANILVEFANETTKELEAENERIKTKYYELQETLKKVRLALIKERTANIMNYGKGGVEMFNDYFEILKGVSN